MTDQRGQRSSSGSASAPAGFWLNGVTDLNLILIRQLPDNDRSRLSGAEGCPLRGRWIFARVGRENKTSFPTFPNSHDHSLPARGSTRFGQITQFHVTRLDEAREAGGASSANPSSLPARSNDSKLPASAALSSTTRFARAPRNRSRTLAMKAHSWRRWLIVLLLAIMLVSLFGI